jgi:tetratricopeptide (TPR) repeat protein
MNKCSGQRSWLFLLTLFLLFFSCATHKKETVQEPFTESVKAETILQTLQEPRQSFDQGLLQKALDGYSTALDLYPAEPLVLKDYIQTLDKIKALADQAFAAKNYDLAHQRYSLLFENFSRFKAFEESLSFDVSSLRSRIKDCMMAQTEIRAQKAFQDGDYTRAIEVYKSANQAFPEESSLKTPLLTTVREIHASGEKSYRNQDYVGAGKVYALFLNEYEWLQNLKTPLPFSDKTLQEGINRCRTHLTRKGLDLYRKKKLKEAIAVWEGLLEFDPENVEIQKAIANAEEQLKKIKKKRHNSL